MFFELLNNERKIKVLKQKVIDREIYHENLIQAVNQTSETRENRPFYQQPCIRFQALIALLIVKLKNTAQKISDLKEMNQSRFCSYCCQGVLTRKLQNAVKENPRKSTRKVQQFLRSLTHSSSLDVIGNAEVVLQQCH